MAQHLIHIGYPKAGSTFLQAWFERHPEIRYAPGGLGGFSDVYELARPSDRVYAYYVTSFEGLATPHESAGGVRLEFGGAEPERVDRIKENQSGVCSLLKSIYPGSRVLIVTRGFRGMIVSAYSQSVRMGGRLHMDGMCRKLAERLSQDAHHYYDYDFLIRLYADAFGEENLIVMPYELLRDDQDGFLAALEERLGLGRVEIKLGRVNPSLSPEELYWYPLISRAVSSAASRLGAARFRRIYTWYVRQTLENRLRHLIKVLRFLRPGGKITGDDFPAEILSYCEGKATLLEGQPLYTPYAAEYLWEEGRARARDHSARPPRLEGGGNL
ncbi:MAG: sulfotransferase [Acidobacteria bacterium]|nr:sulfotransferase [Acidobacteriota bacterium]MCA1643582.1 sulfotransferase [Acidobacteriota bacterium]